MDHAESGEDFLLLHNQPVLASAEPEHPLDSEAGYQSPTPEAPSSILSTTSHANAALAHRDKASTDRCDTDESRFACPFQKHEPQKYSNSDKCSTFGAREIHRLFADHLPSHVKSGELSEDKLNELRTLQVGHLQKRAQARAEERWAAVYRSLFPSESSSSIPSPYVDSKQSTSQSGAVSLAVDLRDEESILNGACSQIGSPFSEPSEKDLVPSSDDATLSKRQLRPTGDSTRPTLGTPVFNLTLGGRYRCIRCSREYRSYSDFHRHYRTKHTPDRSRSCPHCFREFNRGDNLTRHIRKTHGKEGAKGSEVAIDPSAGNRNVAAGEKEEGYSRDTSCPSESFNFEQTKFKGAEQMYERALQGREKTLGPDHPSTLEVAVSLGDLYVQQGMLKEAETTYIRASQSRERTLGPDNTSTLDTFISLGNLYVKQGRLEEAETIYSRALQGREKTLGPDHPSTLDVVKSLGDIYHHQASDSQNQTA